MNRILPALLALLAAFAATAARADPADIAAAARSVVRVVLIADRDGEPELMGHGSGFAVGPDLILTNAHVARPGREDESVRIGVVPAEGKSGWFARIEAYSPQNDLALLRLTEKATLNPMTLFTGPVEDGADVFAVGYPGNVDFAQGLNVGDIVSPTSPVKTQGNVSAGRSSKQFDTILHTAAIGAGNSGGPLLDGCGRVIGANSFGTEMASGADSTFYFAVSMREIMRFLTGAGVKVQSIGAPCRSIADFDRASAEREAASKAEAAREAAEKQSVRLEAARRQALTEVISGRENGMALAGLAVLLALASGGAALWLGQQKRDREFRIAAIAGGVLLLGAIAAWLTRPALSQIDSRVEELTKGEASASPSAAASPQSRAGQYICVLDTERSRVTVSPLTDVPVGWSEEGCVNGRTQYGLSNSGWSRLLVPKQDEVATLASFDPGTGTYQTERYLLDLETMEKLRAERARFTAPSCGDGEAAARKLGEAKAR